MELRCRQIKSFKDYTTGEWWNQISNPYLNDTKVQDFRNKSW